MSGRSVDYRVFEGDTSRQQVWLDLTTLLEENYPVEGEDLYHALLHSAMNESSYFSPDNILLSISG